MLPTFAPGDRIVVNRLAYQRRPPCVGDLIAFWHPWDKGMRLIKRVTAVPGDVIDVGIETHQLGPDEWFVAGDNSESSADSRQFGPIPRRAIIGKVWFRY